MATRRLAIGIAAILAIGATTSAGLAAPPSRQGLAIGPVGAQRKVLSSPLPEGMTADAIDDWVDAILADDEGDLEGAHREWDHVLYRVPKLAIAEYNLADVYRRLEKFDKAAEHYKKYLALEPKASDRAEVGKLITQLTTVSVVTIDGKEPGAVVYLDGAFVGTSPVTRPLDDAWHVVDRIGPQGYWHGDVKVSPGKREHRSDGRLLDPDVVAGNVVTSATRGFGSGGWKDESGIEFKLNQRFTLPAGHYSTTIYNKDYACTPLSFDVKPAPAITYVFIAAAEKEPGKCVPIRVTVQTVLLAGPR